jgi:hypothetical protein
MDLREEVRGMRREAFIYPFGKLDVWRMAVDFAEKILELLENIPPNKHLRLISQILYVAEGSLYETITMIEIFRRRKIFDESTCLALRDLSEGIDRKLNGLRNSLAGRHV